MLSSSLPLAVLLVHIPLVLDQRGAGEAVTDARLASRIAGVPKGLVVGYSFPMEVAGSIAAGVLLLAAFVLLVAGTSAEQRRAALVPGSLAAFSIVVPVVLALTAADYVIVRNTILASVPAAICIAVGFAANRLGLAAAAALCVFLLTITVSVSVDRRYGRTDWRGVADRLEAPTRGRAIVVTPFMSRSLWSPYLEALEEPQGETASSARSRSWDWRRKEGSREALCVLPTSHRLPHSRTFGWSSPRGSRRTRCSSFALRSPAGRNDGAGTAEADGHPARCAAPAVSRRAATYRAVASAAWDG